jgi:hypothetical protein
MNTKVKLAIFWGVVVTSIVLVINFVLHLLGGLHSKPAAIVNGFRPEGRRHHGGKNSCQ